MPFKVFDGLNHRERLEPPEHKERKMSLEEKEERLFEESLEFDRMVDEEWEHDIEERQKRISLKIKGLIAEKGITQAILAEAIKMSRITLNYKLNGKSDFRYPELLEIAKYFGKSVSYFF